MATQGEFPKKNIRLILWKEYLNFGDHLSLYIVSKLSGYKVTTKTAALSWKNFIKCLLRYPWLIKNYVLPYQKNLLAVGSIINLGNTKSIIWGSGFLNNDDVFEGGKIYAIRGPLSGKKVVEMGGNACKIYGDPALLLPLIYKPNIKKKYKIGIIPHWKETDYFLSRFPDYYIIDVRTDNVENIIDKILSCDKILSSSLHGLITAHTYGIPALWLTPRDLVSNGFKFDDYFISVRIKPYKRITHYENILNSENKIEYLFNLNKESTLPQLPIKEIQKKLLSGAPFPIKNTIWDQIKEYPL